MVGLARLAAHSDQNNQHQVHRTLYNVHGNQVYNRNYVHFSSSVRAGDTSVVVSELVTLQ